MDNTYQYPPELLNLLKDVIPKLCKSKDDLITFFRGAGLSKAMLQPYENLLKTDKESFNKYPVAQELLKKINEKGDGALKERREVLKRVTEFQDFSVCWPTDQAPARGLVAQIRDVVNVKDSFTKMNIERQEERKQRIEKENVEKENLRKHKEAIGSIKNNLFKLFSVTEPQKRGKSLETVLNDLFKVYGIGIKEAFTLVGEDSIGVIEQIDGVIELDNHLYFVEMKWWSEPIGVPEISQHLVRVYHRAESRAIIISASDFTSPAIGTCKDSLQQKVVILCGLQELELLLEKGDDLKIFLRKKVNAAIIEKNPYFKFNSIE